MELNFKLLFFQKAKHVAAIRYGMVCCHDSGTYNGSEKLFPEC